MIDRLAHRHIRYIAALVWAAACWPASPSRAADEEAEIVVGCHFSAGEWGHGAIQTCIRENQAARAEVKAYPPEHQPAVERCSRRRELGWSVVKKCVDDEIAAGPALETYARDHGEKVDWCRTHYRERGDTRVLLCVKQSIEAEEASKGR
jgi:hypothetical protein